MNTKILRHRNLLGFIFAIFLTLPMLNVLARVLYTQWNKNAYESYSDDTYSIQQKMDITDLNQLIENQFVYLELVDDTTNYTNNSFYIGYKNFDFGRNIPSEGYFQLGYNRGVSFGSYITICDLNKNKLAVYTTSSVAGLYTFTFTDLIVEFTNSLYGQSMFVYQIITTEQTLDNAFEYSIKKITDNNLGNIQFFTWFADLFVDLSIPQNALYVNFINWYFNYALLVSVAYILFLVLMWFIQFIRRLLEKGMDFGQRGY